MRCGYNCLGMDDVANQSMLTIIPEYSDITTTGSIHSLVSQLDMGKVEGYNQYLWTFVHPKPVDSCCTNEYV